MRSCRRLRGERAVPQARLPPLDRRFRGRGPGRERRGARLGLEWLLRVTGRGEPRKECACAHQAAGRRREREAVAREGAAGGDRPAGAELRQRERPSSACVGGAQEVICPEAKRAPEAPPPCVTGRGGAIAMGGASQLSAANRVENSNANPDWGASAVLELGPLRVFSSAGSPSWLLCSCSVWSFPHVASFFQKPPAPIWYPDRILA